VRRKETDVADAPDQADVLAVHQLYGRQSHAIDSGRAADWAATFTADGEFHSPSYPEPSRGSAELTAFAERFHAGCRASGEVLRHVVSTVEVLPGGPDALRARAYLQIVGTPAGEPSRLHRLTTLDDDLVRTPEGWRVHRRTVRRDP
jgi:3-phenylpropionate/cinnamic acid dioxygenase small subunit